MDLKAFLFEEDRGVSPVIGVILMVAITVILAAVIATFVMNMGPNEDTVPNANWDWSYDDPSSGSDELTLSHTGGAEATASEFVVQISDSSSSDGTYNLEGWGTSDFTAGSEITIDGSSGISGIASTVDLSGATVELIWQNPSNDNTQIVSTWEE